MRALLVVLSLVSLWVFACNSNLEFRLSSRDEEIKALKEMLRKCDP